MTRKAKAAKTKTTARTVKVTYSAEVWRTVCDHLGDGLSWRRIAEQPGMPSRATLVRWAADPDNAATYEAARIAQAQTLVDEIRDIADAPLTKAVAAALADQADSDDGSFEPQIIEAAIERELEHRRLRIDTRKWIAERMAPKHWGSRTQVDSRIGNADGSNLGAAGLPVMAVTFADTLPPGAAAAT